MNLSGLRFLIPLFLLAVFFTAEKPVFADGALAPLVPVLSCGFLTLILMAIAGIETVVINAVVGSGFPKLYWPVFVMNLSSFLVGAVAWGYFSVVYPIDHVKMLTLMYVLTALVIVIVLAFKGRSHYVSIAGLLISIPGAIYNYVSLVPDYYFQQKYDIFAGSRGMESIPKIMIYFGLTLAVEPLIAWFWIKHPSRNWVVLLANIASYTVLVPILYILGIVWGL